MIVHAIIRAEEINNKLQPIVFFGNVEARIGWLQTLTIEGHNEATLGYIRKTKKPTPEIVNLGKKLLEKYGYDLKKEILIRSRLAPNFNNECWG